ncbi:MAG: HugZ family protein [Parvibaculaceae bacterium]
MTNDNPPQRFTGSEARSLLRHARSGALSSLLQEGSPYGSLVNYATDQRGRPLLLLSTLAWHTRNLERDPRASLLVLGQGSSGDPLEGARVTVIGRCARLEEPAVEDARRRYLARHPAASFYAGFKDFGWWRLEIEQAHAVAGFGRIETLAGDEVLLPPEPADTLGAMEAGAVAHMNEDHLDAVQLYATRLIGAAEADWRMAAIDSDGADLTDGSTSLRLAFDRSAGNGKEMRESLIELARRARAMDGPRAQA